MLVSDEEERRTFTQNFSVEMSEKKNELSLCSLIFFLFRLIVVVCNIFTELTFSPLDTNECLTENHGCHPLSFCVNSPGSFHCQCFDGYTGDGHTCAGERVRHLME